MSAIRMDNGQSAILLNASVLVFLFRALATTKPGGARDAVARQLLSLLTEFARFERGEVTLGGYDADPGLWQHLLDQGPLQTAERTAVPLYAQRDLAGALVLHRYEGGIETLSAIASLASVALESARETERLQQENAALEKRLPENGGILGASPAIRQLLDRVERLSARDTTVLIQGETGTGKELVARLIHRASPRAHAPFVAINCAAIADSLLESELFGHEKGAFTGAAALKRGKIEMAHGGTLFLDEIGELATGLQAKLLRVVQQREFERVGATRPVAIDIRLVAATNRDLAERVAGGHFRADLYHRLNVVTLRTPPLRERKEDIVELAHHFLARFGPGWRLSPEACRCLKDHDWPGNVRELENAIEHAAALGDGPVVEPADLPESLWSAAPPQSLGAFQSNVQETKRESILHAYRQASGDYRAAASLLGLHPNYLLRLVRNLGLKEAVKNNAS